MRLFVFVCLIFVSSCSKRNIVYFEGLVEGQEIYTAAYKTPVAQEIKLGDVLAITISSSSPQSDRLFNLASAAQSGDSEGGASSAKQPTYSVDLEGNLTLPIIGRVAAAGMTRSQLQDTIGEKVTEYLQDPTVNIRFLNTKVTVLGEVAQPGTFPVETEALTLLQALGLAGDLTIFGDREKVTVIREVNGRRSVANLNLLDPEVLNSEFYFLQSNDVIYVEPIETKAEQASLTRSNISIALSVLSIITFLIVGRG